MLVLYMICLVSTSVLQCYIGTTPTDRVVYSTIVVKGLVSNIYSDSNISIEIWVQEVYKGNIRYNKATWINVSKFMRTILTDFPQQSVHYDIQIDGDIILKYCPANFKKILSRHSL